MPYAVDYTDLKPNDRVVFMYDHEVHSELTIPRNTWGTVITVDRMIAVRPDNPDLIAALNGWDGEVLLGWQPCPLGKACP